MDDNYCPQLGLHVADEEAADEEAPACRGCGADIHALGEDYRIRDELWRDAAGDDAGGMLCVGCVESRLGRALAPSDFLDVPLNTLDVFPRSDRLRDRLGG